MTRVGVGPFRSGLRSLHRANGTTRKGIGMKVYTVVINGIEHTMQLNDEDAKAMRAVEVKAKEADEPKNKARTAKSKDV